MCTSFVNAKNKKLYDGNGNEFLLKGVGLGGWMLPEGYMWGNHKYYERPRRFEELVLEKTDQEYADLFWDTYYKAFISDKDFELINQHGYNSIRLPINFRMLMEENELDDTVVFKQIGFDLIDYVIDQCKKHKLYLILDLHGAPGGQTGTNIDDSKYDKPELFTNEIYQSQTVKLWIEIAKRYKDETIVAAYDLLNEPLPNWNSHLNENLVPLYKRLIKEIRKIDQNHMFSIEGAHWATDFSMISEVLDENTLLHFHKYWNSPSIETITQFLDKRESLNHPLYMGEGGENDLYWYAAAFKMYDQLDISWNFWTYKKIDNNNSIISFKKPKNWNTIFDKEYEMSSEEAKLLLNAFLKNIEFDNCKINKEVTNHLFRKDEVKIPSAFYDYYGNGISFKTHSNLEGPIRTSDKTDIVQSNGTTYNHSFSRFSKEDIANDKYAYLRMSKGDFYCYTFYITDLKEILVSIENVNSHFDVSINNEHVNVINEGVLQSYKYSPNKHKIEVKLTCTKPGIIRNIILGKAN
jgi:endoglucanase